MERVLHKTGVEEIVNRLYKMRVDWDKIDYYVLYGAISHPLGELDVTAEYKKQKLIFEYKSHNCQQSRETALEQLLRAYNYFTKRKWEVKLFYVSPIGYERIFPKKCH